MLKKIDCFQKLPFRQHHYPSIFLDASLAYASVPPLLPAVQLHCPTGSAIGKILVVQSIGRQVTFAVVQLEVIITPFPVSLCFS